MIELYAPALAEKIRVLKDTSTRFQSTQHRAHFISATQYDIRWLSKMFKPDASQAALDLCAGKIDLFALRWDDQPKAEALLTGTSTRVKGLLHHEHKTPISDIVLEMIESDGSVDSITSILRRMQIVWILKSENKGLKVSKRGDHDKVYADKNIVVVRSPYTNEDWYTHPWKL